MSTRKKGLSMGFASKQKSTLQHSNNRLDSKLVELQKNQEILEAERLKLDELRAQLEAREPDVSPVRLLLIQELHLSGDAQSRVFVNPSVVAEYTERMRFDEATQLVMDPEGKPWAPVRIYEDSEAAKGAPRYWVADGFHRVSAAQALNLTHIQCEVLPGSPRDAIRESLSANARHGLRRTREDKRRAVSRALKDEDWRCWTDQRVADLCAVSRALVSSIRTDLERSRAIPFEIALYAGDGREFEREEPKADYFIQSSSSPTPKKSVAAGKTNPLRAVTVKATSGTRSVKWSAIKKAIEGLDTHTTLIAYPTSKAHYEKLAEHVLAKPSVTRVVCPVMSGSAWLWRGPAILDTLTAHGFDQPVLLTVSDVSKQFVCWARQGHAYKRDTPSRVEVLDTSALLVGKVLDDWKV
jgi:hypothetical protein